MVKALLIGMLVGVLSVYILIEVAAAGYRFGRHLAKPAPAASASPPASAPQAASRNDWRLSVDLVL